MVGGRVAALAACLGLAVLFAGAAYAQPLATPPPVFSSIDANGVDLVTRTFNFSTREVVIGRPGAGGMAFERTFMGPGWRDNYAGTINQSGGVYTVSIGASSERFTLQAGVFVSQERRGSTLAYASGSGVYTYTLPDGTAASFDEDLANGGAVYDANVARIITLRAPSGETTTWHYKSVVVQAVSGRRLQAVTNNLGYQIHFDYSLNNPTLASQLNAWRTLTKATGINTAVDYCSPTADTCSGFTVVWPSAGYARSSGPSGSTYETVTDSLNRATRYTTSTYGLTAIRRPSSATNNHIQINYDVPGRVISVRNSSGTWTYLSVDNAGHRTTTVTDPLSHTRTVVSQIANSQMLSDTNGVGRTTSYQYDSYNRVTRMTMPEGDYTALTYDDRGNVSQTRNVAKPGSGLADITTSASYSATCGNPITCNLPNSTTDARGFRTDYTYDSTHGGLLTITRPAPSGPAPIGSGARPQTRFTYAALHAFYKNSNGSIVAGPSPVYRRTSESSCATTSSCAGGADETVTTIGYGPQASGTANNLLPISIASGAGNGSLTAMTTTTYDVMGNAHTVDGPLPGTSDRTRYRFDAARQLVGVVGPDPDGGGPLKNRAVRNTYNLDGVVTSVEQGTVNSQSDADWAAFAVILQQTTAYDFDGRAIRETLIGGGAARSVVQYSYDSAGRLDCTAYRMNAATFASLPSSACTLTIVAPGLGPDRISRNTYDNANRVTRVIQGYGSATPVDEWTATYTNNGRIATLGDASGNLTTYVYDGFDRLYRMRYPNASGGGSSTTDYEQYSYNAAGEVTVLRRRDGATLTSTYDNLGRVTLVDASANGPDLASAYDLFGRLTSRSISGHTLSFTYDQLGRNLAQTSSVLGAVGYQYDLAGRRTRMTWPDGFYVTYDVNLYDEITAIRENGASTGPGVLASYTYDDLGRRASLTRGNGATESASYDSASNLANLTQNLAGASNDETLSFIYNPLGQIVSGTGSNDAYRWTPLAPGTANYTDNGRNQYTSVAGSSISYDARGNLTNDGARSYGYDIYNRLISVSGAGAMGLTYDAAGRLFETTAGGVATHFLYDGDELIGECDASGVLLRRYVPGAAFDEQAVWYEGAGTGDRRYLVQDERGSVIGVAAAAGVSVYSYDEYGNPNAWSAPGAAPRLRYAGAMMLAPAELYHMRARVYAPALGRFLQTDPILFEGGMNLYAYVGNDPVNALDPLGLKKEACLAPYCGPGRPSSGNQGGALIGIDHVLEQLQRALRPFHETISPSELGEIVVTAERPQQRAPEPQQPPSIPWRLLRPGPPAILVWALTPSDVADATCRSAANPNGAYDCGTEEAARRRPKPGQWSDRPQCNLQHASDTAICGNLEDDYDRAMCRVSAMNRLDYCNRTGEVGWPPLWTGSR